MSRRVGLLVVSARKRRRVAEFGNQPANLIAARDTLLHPPFPHAMQRLHLLAVPTADGHRGNAFPAGRFADRGRVTLQ